MFRLDLGKYSTKGGFLSPTLAAILYQTSLGDFVYSIDASGNAILDNQGTNTSANDGLLYSGRAIELGALNDVDIPIHHTLGADNKKLATSVDAGWTDNLDNTYTGSTVTGDIVGLTTLTSGTFKVTITLSSVTAGDVNGYTTDGTYVFEETLTASLNLTGTGFTGVVTVVSAEQITNQNSYLTYYDFTDGLVTLGNSVDGGSSDNLDRYSNWDSFVSGTETSDSYEIPTGFYVEVIESGVDTNRPLVRFDISGTFLAGETIALELDAVTTGTCSLVALDFATGFKAYSYTFTNGKNIIPVATTTTGTVYSLYFNGTSTFTASFTNVRVVEILPISTKYTLNTKIVNNFLTHTTPWSAMDWTKINNNPNLVGKLALETLGVTKTIPELDMVMDAGASADSYYMCSEKSGAYLVDSRVAYGAEETTLITPQTIGTNNTATTDYPVSNVTTIHNESVGQTGRPVIKVTGGVYDTDIYKIQAKVTITSGTAVIYSLVYGDGSGGGKSEVLSETLTTGTYLYERIVPMWNNGGNNYWYIDFNTATEFTFDGTVETNFYQATATEIANYAETLRTNADLQQKGIQTRPFIRDGAGVSGSFTSKILNYDSLSYDDTQWNPSLESAFWLEEVIDGVVYQHKYDGTNLTTYTDNVAGTPTAHTPENANYLLGKGVYPKVTADPYISYQSKTFQLYTGILYTSYDQTERYAILSAL